MEESSSSLLSNAFTALGITEPTIPPTLKFIMMNIKSIVSTQLTAENYPTWRSQIIKLIRAHGLEGFLDGTTSCPPSVCVNDRGTSSPNPLYTAFILIDQNLASALYSTISPTLLPYVINLESTHEIWTTIERRLQSTNRSRVIHLKNELHNVSMKTQTMAQYLTQIKTIVDNIAAAGSKIDSEDIILYTLNGLSPQNQAFKTSIRTKLTPIHLDEYYALLYSEEINVQKDNSMVIPSEPNTAFYSQRGRGRS